MPGSAIRQKNVSLRVNQLVRLHFNNCLIWNSGLYIMSCVRTTTVCRTRGGWWETLRVVAAVKILSSSQANQKRSCEFQRKAMYLRGLSKNEAQARLLFKAYVDNHVWRTLWWSFRIFISGSGSVGIAQLELFWITTIYILTMFGFFLKDGIWWNALTYNVTYPQKCFIRMAIISLWKCTQFNYQKAHLWGNSSRNYLCKLSMT